MKYILKHGMVIVAAAVFIVSVYFVAGVLLLANAQYDDMNKKNLENAAGILKSSIPSTVFSDKGAAAEWVSGSGGIQTPLRITLITRNGEVIFDTEADSSVMENHMDRREFQAAVREGTGSDRRRSATLQQDYFYTAVAVHDSNGQFSGVLRLSESIPSFFSRLLGSALPFLAGGLLIIIGVSVGLYGFSRRVSREAEAKLNAALEKRELELKEKTAEAEAEGRYREVILNSTFEGVITLDNKGSIVFANPRICSLFGVDAENNAGGMSIFQFSNSAELAEAVRQVIETGRPLELAIKRFASGTAGNKFPGNKFQVNKFPQYFEVFLAPIEQGVVVALRDTSRLVRLEQVRKDFAANVSHELRTPIQVIQGFAETILDSPLDDKEQIRHFTGIIRKNAQGMENLTNDLLTLVSLEDKEAAEPASRFPMEKSALLPLITEAADAVAIAARNKNIIIAVTCPQGLSAKVHGALFVQALVNLLDNSIKYSGEGSSIQVSAFAKGEELVVEVKDRGIGIPAEHIDRIFERFYRVDRSRSRQAGGTGLGLSIVRHIALLHNGTVEAESHAGEGSVFTIRLPLL